jgi:hypothetical protein
LLNELAKVAFASMGDYFDADGNIRPIQDLSEDEKAAIWSIDITEKPDGTKTTKIRLNNKLTAMEKLARHTGFYNPEFIPEKVYVYLDKEQMDKWDRLDDNSMDAAAPKARLAPSGFGAVYDEIYCWEDELREREAALDKREAELNGLTLAATAQEGSAESGGKGEELETGVEVGCVVAEMPVKEAHTATTTTDEKKVIGHLPGQYTADGYLIKTDMPADWDKNDPYYDPFARRYVEKKVSSNMIVKSYLPSPDSKVRKAYKNGRL